MLAAGRDNAPGTRVFAGYAAAATCWIVDARTDRRRFMPPNSIAPPDRASKERDDTNHLTASNSIFEVEQKRFGKWFEDSPQEPAARLPNHLIVLIAVIGVAMVVGIGRLVRLERPGRV